MRVLMRAALAVWSPMVLIGGLGTGGLTMLGAGVKGLTMTEFGIPTLGSAGLRIWIGVEQGGTEV